MGRDAVEHNRRMDDIADRLQARFADADGRHAEDDEIDALVHLTAERFVDARVQEFVPLLVEHQASDALRDRGMRPVGLYEPNVATPDESEAGPSRVDRAGQAQAALPIRPPPHR